MLFSIIHNPGAIFIHPAIATQAEVEKQKKYDIQKIGSA